jgi:hypothetical protein
MSKKTKTKTETKTDGPILPDVTVDFSNIDGNAFMLIGTVAKAIRRAGHADRVAEFQEEATSGDYDNVLRTCMKWVNVE